MSCAKPKSTFDQNVRIYIILHRAKQKSTFNQNVWIYIILPLYKVSSGPLLSIDIFIRLRSLMIGPFLSMHSSKAHFRLALLPW